MTLSNRLLSECSASCCFWPSVWFWLTAPLPLAYGLILVIASFMVFNDLENAGNMASCCKCWRPRWIRQPIDDTPVMDEKGADITPKSSEIVFNKVDFSYADRKILGSGQLYHLPKKRLRPLSALPGQERQRCAT